MRDHSALRAEAEKVRIEGRRAAWRPGDGEGHSKRHRRAALAARRGRPWQFR